MAVIQAAVDETPSVPTATSGPSVTIRYAWYAVVLLTLINVMASLDRRVINVLAEPIKNELHLSDAQVGLMTGLAFALFYAALGFPIARLADRSSRPAVIAGSLAVWSIFTTISSTASNFMQLFLYRLGVGVGEAGCGPPAQSLITEYAPRHKRSSFLAFWSMGVPLGALIGFPLGGLISDHYGWRTAFLVAGSPGILLALLAVFSLKETRKRVVKDAAVAKAKQPSIGELMKVLVRKRTYWILMVNTAVKMVNTYSLQAFVVSFFLRNHKESISHLATYWHLKPTGFLGIAIGLISGVCGALSIFIGGWLADRSAAKDIRSTMIAPAVGGLIAMPITFLALWIDNAVLALAVLAIPYLLNGFGYGPVTAVMNSIVPANMRASSASMALFLEVIIGQAMGPFLIGMLSDTLAQSLGAAEGLRWSLIVSCSLAIPCAVLYLAARKTMREDIES